MASMDVHEHLRRAGNSGSASDWISATSSIVASIVGLVTLLTVYVAAMQLLSRRQLYRLGVSTKSLGPWKSRVVTPSLLRMQTQISTPTVSLRKLVKNDWQPKITFPVGFNNKSTKADSDPEILAEASWVNFLQALGLTPECTEFYQMQSESELVNGIVPMRWKGRDLVGICSMLGFQSHEAKPSAKTPMPLPMLWSGPLGWLQFRASSEGCVVEYRRRAAFQNQLSVERHNYYIDLKPRPLCLKSRLWQSINGLYLPDDRLLYIGGSDPVAEKLRNRRENTQRSVDEICEEVMASDMTNEQLMRVVWGKKADRPKDVSPGAIEKGPSQLPQSEFLPEYLRELSSARTRKSEQSKNVQVLRPCRGLLSIIVEGELVGIRGLDLSRCHELNRAYTDPEEVNQEFKHTLGRFRMDSDLLDLLKKAVLLLQPDGFYFTPTKHLCSDVNEIWQHVTDHSDKLDFVFPPDQLEGSEEGKQWGENGIHLFHAVDLCNQFQHIKMESRVMFTIEDMVIISKASNSLRGIVTESGTDIIWAMIVSPDLFSFLVKRFAIMDVQDVLKATVEYKGEVLDCTALGATPTNMGNPGTKFPVPLMSNGTFSGAQVLAAFVDVFLTYFWIDRCWISDVAVYDATIPQSVTMC